MRVLYEIRKNNNLCSVWSNEASDFTNWLVKEDNLVIGC